MAKNIAFQTSRNSPVITAATADIIFDNNVSGFLQDFSVRENYNVKPVVGLGTAEVQMFLPGFFDCAMSAKAAVFDLDFIQTSLVPYMGVDGIRLLSNYFKFDSFGGFLDSSSLAPYISNKQNPGQDFWNSFGEQFAKTIMGKVISQKVTSILYFDIQIADANGEIRFKWKDCMLEGRTISISVNNILIISDLSIRSRGRLI